jgi:NAD(P)-dependent dehydrogenase (short-subunit alcohol dehydrogenase family)
MHARILDLNGRVALVTGGSRGIGRAISLALASCGASVAVNYRQRDNEAADVIAEIERIGGRAIAVRADVSLSGEVDAMIADVCPVMNALPMTIITTSATSLASPSRPTGSLWATRYPSTAARASSDR